MGRQLHHVLFARAMAMALTRLPVDDAVRGLVDLSAGRPEILRLALAYAEGADWHDDDSRQRAAGLIELALHDVGAGLRATA